MLTLQSINPATGALVGEVPISSADEIAKVVGTGRRAQGDWQASGVKERAKLLVLACQSFGSRADALGELLTKEMGKPIAEARGEVASCGRVETEIAEMVRALEPECIEDGRTKTMQYRDGYGVCAAITPWNFPIAMPHWMVLPALMAGNTVVLKPSEETPLIAQAYVEALNQVLPHGVLEIVHGADDQGKALVASDVDLIAFTGSREVGKKILAASSSGLKRVILELGGKDPMIVLKGADLKRAGKFAASNSFRNAGQVCVSTERIYVNAAEVDEFVGHLCEATKTMTVGDGLQHGTNVGPMINSRQRDHVLQQIDQALAKGASLVHGGTGHHDNFIMPTVLRGVTHAMDIAKSETFGPVACVFEVDSDKQAIELANDTVFGLGATVFGPQEAAIATGRKLRAGMVGINKSCDGAAGTPWIGAGESGYGFHKGIEGHRQFAQLRLLSTRL